MHKSNNYLFQRKIQIDREVILMECLIGFLLLIVGWLILFATSSWSIATLVGGIIAQVGLLLFTGTI